MTLCSTIMAVFYEPNKIIISMKKILSFLILSLVVFAFSGCFSSAKKVAFMNLNIIDDSSLGVDYSESSLKITPNYEKRTIDVWYFRTFPRKGNLLPGDEVSAVGEFGGENFDRFEKMVKFVMKNGSAESVSVLEQGDSTLLVAMQDIEENIYSFDIQWNDENEKFDDLREFYVNLVGLLTESEQV